MAARTAQALGTLAGMGMEMGMGMGMGVGVGMGVGMARSRVRVADGGKRIFTHQQHKSASATALHAQTDPSRSGLGSGVGGFTNGLAHNHSHNGEGHPQSSQRGISGEENLQLLLEIRDRLTATHSAIQRVRFFCFFIFFRFHF